MYCPNCGFDVTSGTFCPNCGAKLPDIAASVETADAQNIAAPTAYALQTAATEPAAKNKKRGKKPVIVVAVALVLVAAIICGIVFGLLPKLGSPKNIFADKAKNVEKDSEAYHVLNVLSALDNNLFNSESFTLAASVYDEEVFSLKARFGKDIADSEVCIESCGDPVLCLYDGQLLINHFQYGAVNNYYYATQVDVKDLLNNLPSIIESGKKALNAEYDDINEYIAGMQDAYEDNSDYEDYEYYEVYESSLRNQLRYRSILETLVNIANDSAGEVETAVSAIIKDNKLNRDSLNTIAYLLLNENFDDAANYLADFVAEEIDDSIIKVEQSKNGKTVEYDYKLKIDKLYRAAADYIEEHPEIFDADFITEYFEMDSDSIAEEIAYMLNDESEYLEDESIKGSVTIESNHITELIINHITEFTFEDVIFDFYNINATTIDENDYKSTEKKCDEIESFDSEDLIDLFEQY